jgi:hypothetical protein
MNRVLGIAGATILSTVGRTTLQLIVTVASMAIVVAGCIGSQPSPSPSPTSSPSPSPSPSASPTIGPSAALVVTADGTVECRRFPHGCLASFIIEPGRWVPPADWEPADDTPYFGSELDPWELDGRSVLGAPAALAAGDYTFGIAISELNDIIGDPNQYLEAHVLCTAPVRISPDTTTVTVHANFDAPCSIGFSLVSIAVPSTSP